jgi:hypothetical protein
MSVNLGIYDFFAYLVPGLMYLVLFNDFSARMGWGAYDLAQVNSQISIGTIGIVALSAYVIGNIFDVFAHWFCFSLLTRRSMPEAVLENLKQQYPDLNIAYRPKDYHLLFVLLRARNPGFTQTIDRFESNSIMLKNISFIAALFSILHLPELFTHFSLPGLLLVLAGVAACWLAYRASKAYHTWFFLDVFQASLEYGLSTAEVIQNEKPKQPN